MIDHAAIFGAVSMSAPQPVVSVPRSEAAIEYGLSLKLEVPWETNAQGQIIVNPPIGLQHAKFADRLIALIKSHLPGWHVWPEVGIHTSDGVKAPDLAVAPPDFVETTDAHGFLLRAPDLCVEIMSPSNTWEEMCHKARLYSSAGAKEVWVCDGRGELHFFDGAGPRERSVIAGKVASPLD
jgi:Uma2 family endonuclease